MNMITSTLSNVKICYNKKGDEMRYLKEKTVHQIEVNKSIFIGILYPLSDKDDIDLYLEDAKTSYPKANHYCFASIFGEHGEHMRASDDGEPQRTAGIPILEVLKHKDVTDVLCVVIRYFGGIKLGAGGLVRAYTNSAASVLNDAKFYQKLLVPAYQISFDYPLIHKMDHLLEEKATITEKQFLDIVTYTFVLNDLDDSFLEEIKYQLKTIQKLPPKIIHIESQ